MPSDVVTPLVAPSPSAPKTHVANIYQNEELSPEFVQIISDLEAALELKIWLLVQNGDERWDEISYRVYEGFRDRKTDINRDERVGLLLHRQVAMLPQLIKSSGYPSGGQQPLLL